VVLIALVGLAACSRRDAPAPVEYNAVSRSPQSPPAAAGPAVAAAPAGGGRDTAYVVQRGDTAYAVARRFDVPVKAIIDANNLQPPYGVQAGQRLVIPRPRGHLVEAGDTVASVSKRYGVDQSALVRANALQPPYALQPGQRLTLPASVAGATQEAAAPPPMPAPLPAPAASPAVPPPRAVETAALPAPATPAPPNPPPTAASPPITMAPVASAPPPAVAAAPPPAAAAPKPPADKPATAATTASPPPAPAAASAPPPSAAPSEPPAAEPPASAPPPQLAAIAPPAPEAATPPALAPVEPVVAAPPPRDTTPVGPPPPRAGKTFLWPLRGRVIATFGEQGRGLHNDGLNIAAPRGTPIRAAENGVVAYAGNEIRGFGNLLLVRHAGGYVTAYAHADTLLVKRGDTVHRGQTIARVGATGSVTEPQLHFEIREGSQPVDPQRFLGSPSA
jgi:murein DD-endopeptidase MepM/ murein hydrolase activator NlpD